MSSTCRLSFFGVDVSTSRPSNSNWGSGSFNTNLAESCSCKSTNFSATIWLTTFAGPVKNPGPTTNGWCGIGVWASEEIPPRLSGAVTATVLVEDVKAGVGGANAGTTKSGLPWTVEVQTAGETDQKPTPEAAKAEAWASSSRRDKDELGTPPSAATIGKLVAKLVAGVEGRFEVCSAASACLTAFTAEARKAGYGWSDIGDWDVAGGSDELVLRMQAVRSFCSYTAKPSTVTLIFYFMILTKTMLPFNEKFKKRKIYAQYFGNFMTSKGSCITHF